MQWRISALFLVYPYNHISKLVSRPSNAAILEGSQMNWTRNEGNCKGTHVPLCICEECNRNGKSHPNIRKPLHIETSLPSLAKKKMDGHKLELAPKRRRKNQKRRALPQSLRNGAPWRFPSLQNAQWRLGAYKQKRIQHKGSKEQGKDGKEIIWTWMLIIAKKKVWDLSLKTPERRKKKSTNIWSHSNKKVEEKRKNVKEEATRFGRPMV